jgi:N-acetyl-gamma-glutamylphosphate reductase
MEQELEQWPAAETVGSSSSPPPAAGQPWYPLHSYVACHTLAEGELRALYSETYGAEPFTFLLPAGQVATLAHTVHTNYCAIGLTPVPESRTLIVTVSIDNLVKGASGQAIQNMNLMFGLDERAGLI